MKNIRTVSKTLRSIPTLEGAGVRLRRAFGFHQVPDLDPFLLLDDFHSDLPSDYTAGFPWHPHRGIETITYVIHGLIEHGDSMGNSGVIRSGDIQWMTAGSGIIHQEMPKPAETTLLQGFQLWANLPASHKMMEPRYRDIKNPMIPSVTTKTGAVVRVIAGTVEGVTGPVTDIVTRPQYLDISIPPMEMVSLPVTPGHTVFAYVISGKGRFDVSRDRLDPAETLVILGDGDKVMIRGGDDGVRFLLVSGKPIGEPVAWYGPIVMNTEAELKLAFEEYEQGTFLKHAKQG